MWVPGFLQPTENTGLQEYERIAADLGNVLYRTHSSRSGMASARGIRRQSMKRILCRLFRKGLPAHQLDLHAYG